jgi:hypothetical protein
MSAVSSMWVSVRSAQAARSFASGPTRVAGWSFPCWAWSGVGEVSSSTSNTSTRNESRETSPYPGPRGASRVLILVPSSASRSTINRQLADRQSRSHDTFASTTTSPCLRPWRQPSSPTAFGQGDALLRAKQTRPAPGVPRRVVARAGSGSSRKPPTCLNMPCNLLPQRVIFRPSYRRPLG